ncbi:hypothetical protein HK097_010213 [Rhizophlyctis rosea]|uniref:Uncharacterized protein n=1 Tax=Rhizophlyctis rosea TaxID=64517 RepID=A0AAD5SI79_9FUNG|nr:hypothetical protein HK097_010213 [Rhizophlyctis rosea]
MNNFATREFYSIVIGGSLLAANAGFINVVTLAGVFSVTVSHLTGNVSRIAIALFQADITTLMLITSIIFSFGFGSFVAGYMVGDSKFRLGQSYGYGLILCSASLFGSFLFLRKELIVGEWCAAFACGLQNALATSYSGAVVRTTHMSGIITDIGNICGQACRKDTKAETWRLRVHIPLLLSYTLGGLFGQLFYLWFKENSLLVPCFFTGFVAATYLYLPMVKEAAEVIKQGVEQTIGMGHHPAVEVRVLGDPRKSDLFAKLQGKDVDLDIKNFLTDLEDDAETGRLSRQGSRKGSVGGKGKEAVEMREISASARDGKGDEEGKEKEGGKRPSLTIVTAPTGEGEFRAQHGGGSVEVLYTATPQD